MKRVVLLLAITAFAPRMVSAQSEPTAPQLIESRIELRPIDRATVRIIAVHGATTSLLDSRETRVRRLFARPSAVFGTGVFVDRSGLVLTAAHVTRGAELLAVVLTGTDTPVPARVVYVDEYRDIAVLHANTTPSASITLPRSARRLRVGERISGTGYPVTVRERYPAAFAGVLSRENLDGSLQAAMSLNPGNSGGPIVDDAGEIIGIVSRRGEPREGIEGIALFEPLRFVLPAVTHAREMLAANQPVYGSHEVHIARVLADFIRTSIEQSYWEQTSVSTLEAATTAPARSLEMVLVGLHAWNMHIALLEARGVSDASALEGDARALCERLRTLALDLVRRSLADSPYLRVAWSAARDVHVGGAQSFVAREGGRSERTLAP